MWDCSFSTLFFSSWRIAYNLVNIVVFLFSLVPQPSWYMHACKQCCKPQCFQTITFPHHSLQIFSTFYWEWSEYRWDTERRQPKCSALSHMFSKSIFVCACLGWSCELLLPFFCVKSLICSTWSRFFFFFFFYRTLYPHLPAFSAEQVKAVTEMLLNKLLGEVPKIWPHCLSGQTPACSV